jgi:uncharacterized protein (TIGR02246 family)
MQQFRRALVAVAGALALAACAGPPAGPKVDPAADEAAVRAVNPAWFKAYNAGDGASVAALYADDALLSPPGVPAARGGAAIREFFAQDVAASKAAGLSFAADPSTDVGISGDLAWETGRFTVNAADGSTVDTGKFTTVMARRDGGWKIIRDTWNSDAPPPVAPGTVLRIVRFTSSSGDAQQAAMKLVDEEIHSLYGKSKGFRWVKYFVDPKTLATGSVSAWDSAADVEAFLQSDGYKPIPGKLKPLMKGAMVSDVYEVHAPPK